MMLSRDFKVKKAKRFYKKPIFKQLAVGTQFSNLSEVIVWRCSVKRMFLKISQNSQENTCARVSVLIKLQARGLKLY